MGLEVSVNRIVGAAGQRNPSAVRLHFGGRQELLAAVLDRRGATVDAAHRARALAGGPRGPGRLADDLVAPFAELGGTEAGLAYLRLVAQHLARPDTGRGAFAQLFPTAAITIATLVDRGEAREQSERDELMTMIGDMVVHASATGIDPRLVADAVVAVAAGRGASVAPHLAGDRPVW